MLLTVLVALVALIVAECVWTKYATATGKWGGPPERRIVQARFDPRRHSLSKAERQKGYGVAVLERKLPSRVRAWLRNKIRNHYRKGDWTVKTKDPTASCDLTIKFYCLECVGAYFAEAVNSADELIASTHLWESKTDVWRELATLLSQCEAVTAWTPTGTERGFSARPHHLELAMQNPKQTLAAEMLAVTDSLRHLRSNICRMVHDGEEIVLRSRNTALILIDGLNVAIALEELVGVVAGLTKLWGVPLVALTPAERRQERQRILAPQVLDLAAGLRKIRGQIID